MKKRASLLQFAAALAVVVSIAIGGLSIARHNQAKYISLAVTSSRALKPSAEQIGVEYGRLPLSFKANLGQTAPEVQFLSQGMGYELFLTRQDAVLALWSGTRLHPPRLSRPSYATEWQEARAKDKTSVLRLHFDGANPAPQVAGVDRLPGRTDYFIGNDPKNWHTEVPSYSRVAYQGIYSGVDAVFYGNQRQLEYDFIVAPGADPKQIALDVEGAERLGLDAKGNLLMGVSGSEVKLLKPVVYQDTNGGRREIAANYAISGNHRVTFSIGNYDRNDRLVIDPVLDYSTYLGGAAQNTFGVDTAFGIAVDSSGDAYVTGQTFSTSFPTTATGYTPGPLTGGNPNGAVFVTELNPTGTSEVYSTYLIGTDTEGDYGYAIALDPSGKIYVAGQTFSTGFPTTANAAQTAPTDPTTVINVGTAFLSKIDPTMSGANSLVYSSYLGGSGGAVHGDFADAVAADASGNAYVAGETHSSDFLAAETSATGYQTSNPDTTYGVAFLVKVNTGGSGPSSVVYSTYLGGDGKYAPNGFGYGDDAYGVAVDSSSNAYLVGETTSSNFPIVNGLVPNASNTVGEGFVSRIDTTKTGASSLIYSTYLGGQVEDLGAAIALGPNNVAYVAGFTQSSQFPTTPGAYTSPAVSAGVAFVTVLDTTQIGIASLKYSALVGGSSGDSANGVATDSAGNAYVAGVTGSSNFPITSAAYQTSKNNASGTGFLFKLNPGGKGNADLAYSTYFGGSGPGGDTALAVAVDSGNNPYIAGQTGSTNFPVYPSNSFQTTLTQFDASAVSAGFVAKLTLEPTIVFSTTTLAFGNEAVGATSTTCGGVSPCVVTLTNNTGAAITPLTIQTLTGANPGDFSAGGGGATPCTGSVPAAGSCTIAVTFTPSINGAESATLPIQYTVGTNAAATQNISLTGTGVAAPTFTLAPGTLPAFPATLITSTNATTQPVTLTNGGTTTLVFTISASTNFGENDNCGGAVGLAGGASCTINVSFTPATAGPLMGTLTASSEGISQTTQLSGTGGDFSLTSLPTSVPITNNAGSFTASLTATTGFTPSVSFACVTTIPNGSCTATPNPATAPTQVMVNISVAAAVPPSGRPNDMQRLLRPIIPLVAALLLLLSLPLIRRRRTWLGLAGIVLALVVLSACSGGSHSPQTYNVMVTASSTSNGTTVSHPYTVSAVVQ